MELVNDFKTFLSSIQPGDDEVAAAKAAHEKVRDELRTDSESKEAHKDTFLSGSYARRTAINDINDVDVICILDIDRTITAARGSVSAWFRAYLSGYYKETRPQGRSIGAEGAKEASGWTSCPRLRFQPTTGRCGYRTETPRNGCRHIPKDRLQRATTENKATNGYFVQVVKLLKFWRDKLPTKSSQLKSYILEALIHKTIGTPSSHAGAIVSVLEGIESNYGVYRGTNIVPSISDPGYASVNVMKRLPTKEFDDFMVQVRSAAVTARSAFNNTDEAASRKLWRQLFGSEFGK